MGGLPTANGTIVAIKQAATIGTSELDREHDQWRGRRFATHHGFHVLDPAAGDERREVLHEPGGEHHQ
jgi:hypothetical protein